MCGEDHYLDGTMHMQMGSMCVIVGGCAEMALGDKGEF